MRNHRTFSSLIMYLALGSALCLSSCSKKENHMPEQSQAPRTVLEDVSIYNLDREKVSLHSEIAKNNITIIDFWASWCQPCINSMPAMKEIFEEYSGKGLGIIGVSYDKDYSSWTNAISELDLKWLQLSDLRGWEDTTCEKYAINSIPHTIVVNKDAEILVRGLSINDLKAFVKKRVEGGERRVE